MFQRHDQHSALDGDSDLDLVLVPILHGLCMLRTGGPLVFVESKRTGSFFF